MLAALLLAAAAPPETALLDAFRAACQRVDDFEAAKADAAAAGWEAVAEDADPRIAKLTSLGREAVGTDGKLSGATYLRRIAGRDVFLVLTRYEDDGGTWGNGCRVFDFGAPAAVAPKIVDGWMGRIPTGTDADRGVLKRLWEPGWHSGVTVEVSFVPRDHPVAQSTGLEGVILVAQAIGGF